MDEWLGYRCSPAQACSYSYAVIVTRRSFHVTSAARIM
jgi:hypothetical protein